MTTDVLEIFRETIKALNYGYELTVITNKFLAELCSPAPEGKRECVNFGEAVPELGNFVLLTNQKHALLLGATAEREIPRVGDSLLQEVYGERWFPALKDSSQHRWSTHRTYLPYSMIAPLFTQAPDGLLDDVIAGLRKKEGTDELSSMIWASTMRPMTTTVVMTLDDRYPVHEGEPTKEVKVPYGSELWDSIKKIDAARAAEDSAAVTRGEGKTLVCPECGKRLVCVTETSYDTIYQIFVSPNGKVVKTVQKQEPLEDDDVDMPELVCLDCGWRTYGYPEEFIKTYPLLLKTVDGGGVKE